MLWMLKFHFCLVKAAMKAANTTIDFAKDQVNMFGRSLCLRFTSSGHYCIPPSG